MQQSSCPPSLSQTPLSQSLTLPSADLQTKQLYLREHILECDLYDPQQFVTYLNARLSIESDLQKCSLEQLETVVLEFKAKKSGEVQEAGEYFRDGVTEQIEPSICLKNESVREIERVLVRAYPEVIEDQYYGEVKCVKISDQFQAERGKIVCEVRNPERKYSGGVMGIGGTSFLNFEVWTYGLSKEPVARRYSDFIWLRQILKKFYPSYILPPIPNKKASKRLPRQILKRMRILTYFLNDLVKEPIFLNNRYVQAFLLTKDNNRFEKIKQEGDNKKSYESILSTQTLSGVVSLQLSNRTMKYKDGLNKFIPELENYYKEITRNSKKMKNMTLQKINLLYSMANQFAELFDKTNKFNTFVKTDSGEKMSQIYAVLNNMMVEWGNSLKKEIEEVEKNMNTFFKYAREQLMGFQELLDRTNNVEEVWLKEKQILDRQKEKIFQLKDPKRWELNKKQLQNLPKSAIYDKSEAFKIMLPKESVHVENLKQNFAYYLAEFYKHGNQKFLNTSTNFCDNFKQFSIKTKVNNQQIGAMWSEVSIKFSDPYKKPTAVQTMQLQKLFDQSQSTSNVYQD